MDDNQHMKDIVVFDNGDTIRTFRFNVYGSPYYPGWHLNSLVISGKNDVDKLEYGFSYFNNNPGDYTDYWGNRCNAGPSIYAANGQTINNYGLDNLGNFNLFFAYDGIGLDRAGIQEQLNQNGILAQLIENDEGDPYYYYKLKLQSTTDGDTRIPTTPDKHGVLNAIFYPNGGHTTFSWENHRFPTATAVDGDLVFDRRSQRIIEGGGFRIESIINWTADGEIASKDYYRYGFTLGDIIHKNFPLPLPDNLNLNDTVNHHIGCGEAVVDPNLFTFMSGFSYSKTLVPGTTSSYSYADPTAFRNMLIGQDSRFKNISYNQNIQGIPMWWEVTFSASKFRSLIGGRRPVVYPEITVYHGHPYDLYECKSKTVYKYDIYSQFDFHTYYLSSIHQTTVPDTAYFEPIYFDSAYPALSCNEHPAHRHQLKSKSDYSYNAGSGTWELVSEDEYNYSNDSISKSGFTFESVFSRENYYPNYNNLSYNQIGYNHPLINAPLRDFYKPVTQKLGRSTLCEKNTTIIRQGGTPSNDNIQTEAFSYLYSGILKEKDYTDLYYRIRNDYHGGCDKIDIYSYASEEENDSVISEMNSRNMLASLTSAETFTTNPWSSLLSGNKIKYKFFGNNILPFKLYESNGDQYEESMEVLSYDAYGNPTEIQDKKTEVYSVFLWDVYGRYLIAMIKDARLSQIQNVAQLRTVSSQTRHSMLQSTFQNAQVQTWDYLPLIGVTSHTDINGQTVLFEYDGLGRLKTEKRVVNGNSEPEILREYDYHFINQQ